MVHPRATFKRRHWPAIALTTVFPLSGCFFDQVQRSEEDDIQRVEHKQATLQTAQDKAATLREQEEQLAAELSGRQLSLNELNDRVQEINAENGRALAQNEAARLQYHELLTQLHQTSEQLALAKQGQVGTIAERREHIASLKAQLKAQIDLLVR